MFGLLRCAMLSKQLTSAFGLYKIFFLLYAYTETNDNYTNKCL